MANENVKITILEKDNTKPGGAGIAPSDIAFVPGLSCLPDAVKNVPTLCNDYLEFEKLFGKTPKVLNSRDVNGYEDYGFIAGSFDKSYIYAKELLLQGMPVIYSNIVDENTRNLVPLNATMIKELSLKDVKNATFTDISVGDYQESGIVTLTPLKSFTGDVIVDFKYEVVAKASSNNIPVTTSFEFDTAINVPEELLGKITKVELTVPKGFKIEGATHELLSSNQIDIINTTDKVINYVVNIRITLDLSIEFDETTNQVIELGVSEVLCSCLDVFYGENPLIKEQLNLIKDKSIYSVKYITSGGYPSVVSRDGKTAITPFATEMLDAAEFRGDAVALIDYQRAEDEIPFDVDPTSGSFYAKMQQAFNGISNSEYGAAFYPWGEYSCGASLSNVVGLDSNDVYMPASFSYMMCVAKAIKTSPNWLAMAGVSRGIVPKLNKICTPNNVLSNTIAEEMQPKFGVEGHNLSVNCITNIRPYGLTLWGNRTMKAMSKEGAVALNFLNTRNMLSDIKKVLYSTAKSLMFEQNSDTLWLRFKAGVSPLLNQLKTGQGISDYKIVKGTTKYNGDPLQKGEMAAVIKIYPLHAVEYFELTVEINDEDVVVS